MKIVTQIKCISNKALGHDLLWHDLGIQNVQFRIKSTGKIKLLVPSRRQMKNFQEFMFFYPSLALFNFGK